MALQPGSRNSKQSSSSRQRSLYPLYVLLVLVLLAVALVPGSSAFASVPPAISLTGLESAYTQNFDTLSNVAGSTTNVLTLVGWDMTESGGGARDNEQYAVDTGASTSGDTYSYGAAGSTDRALGSLQSGTLIPTFGASFTNNTGSAIGSLDIAYTGEEWRLGTAARTDELDFQYSLDATSLTTGTWVNVAALNFVTPDTATTGAKNGNSATDRTNKTGTISSLNIANGATFWIRWVDYNASGADDGLAVDDFSLTPHGISGIPNLTINDVSRNEGNSGTTTFTFTVSLSAPAGVGGVMFDIATADGTATAPGDYAAQSLTGQIIPEGSSTYTFDVLVNGDTTIETDETFYVNITNVTGANLIDGQGLGTIRNDDYSLVYIHDIQGTGATSPMVGQTVKIQGVVVGDYQKTTGQTPVQFSGFFLEEEDADWDADPLTSEGIFVYCSESCMNVNQGDVVSVVGTVTEYQGLTELGSVNGANVQVISTGASVTPVVASLPVSALTDLERFEGMLVTFPQSLTVSEVYSLGRYGQVTLSANGKLMIPTNVVSPGAPAIALENQNLRSQIVLDDGVNSQNPDPEIYPAPGLSASNTLRVGDTTTNLTGVMDYRFSAYRIQPVGTVAWAHDNPRPASPASTGGSLKVAGLNMLNYFVTLGAGYNCGPTGGLQCRGATNATEFTRQRTKLINAITAISPDMAGLMEMENDAADGAAQNLVDGLNAVAGAGTYDFIHTGPIGTDAIRLAILYKPGRVTPVGSFRTITSADNPLFLDTKNRPSLAQTFALNTTGAKVTLVVNHLKSKGSDCNDVGDPDTGDGQGNCNLTRTNAVNAITQWLATDPTGSGDPDYVIVGDMNAYAKEDPITAFTNAGYTNLIEAYLGAQGYSYVYNAETGYLDHALASPGLVTQVTGVTEWHINADEPIVLDYNTEYKSAGQINNFYSTDPYRASDHDPVVVGMNLNAAPTVSANGPYTVTEGATVALAATGSDPENGALTYAWDLDNNGTFEQTGQSVNVSAANIAGPASRTVKVQVTDVGGLTATDTTTINIQNVAPTITSVTNNGPVLTDSSATITVSATDPGGTGDSLAYEFDCNNDGNFEIGPQAGNTAGCTFANAGSYPVPVRVKDTAGSSATGSTTVAVSIPSPVLTSLYPPTAQAGATAFQLTLNGSGFVNGSVVQWNSMPLSTVFLGSTQLAAMVPANLIATTGTALVTVVNPGGIASLPMIFTIGQTNTTLTLTSSANPSAVGQPVTFVAVLTQVYSAPSQARGPRDVIPTGMVTFAVDGVSISSIAIGTNGVATYTTSGLAVGSHTVTATYSGDPNLNPATSNTVTQVVTAMRTHLPFVAGNYVSAPNLVVQSIMATPNNIQVVVKNTGNAPVADDFWVDLYINPSPVPTRVNQTWSMLSSQGAVWGVSGAARAALTPGGTITLSLGDAYYFSSLSKLTLPLAVGTKVYVQVDSANMASTFGAVPETHELLGAAYDNIASTNVVLGQPSGAKNLQGADPALGKLPERP